MFTREQFLQFCASHGVPAPSTEMTNREATDALIRIAMLACETIDRMEQAERTPQPRPKIGLNGVRSSRASA